MTCLPSGDQWKLSMPRLLFGSSIGTTPFGPGVGGVGGVAGSQAVCPLGAGVAEPLGGGRGRSIRDNAKAVFSGCPSTTRCDPSGDQSISVAFRGSTRNGMPLATKVSVDRLSVWLSATATPAGETEIVCAGRVDGTSLLPSHSSSCGCPEFDATRRRLSGSQVMVLNRPAKAVLCPVATSRMPGPQSEVVVAQRPQEKPTDRPSGLKLNRKSRAGILSPCATSWTSPNVAVRCRLG